MATSSGKGTVRVNCPASAPHALSWSASPINQLRDSKPLHGSAVATNGQAATGWLVKALKSKTQVTVYLICGP